MALSAEQKARCAAWCEKHANTWQILNRSNWKYQWRGKTMVRYVDVTQVRVNDMEALLEYLSSDDCLSTLSLNKQSVAAGAWRPLRAWYEVSNKAAGAIGGVRLYHALSTDPPTGGDGPYVVEDGCAYKVSWTFYWRQQSIIEVPQGESGISYRIVNLSRDPDDGTFTYTFETRERVQQDIAEYETAVTAFETRSEEQHLGVSGGADEGGLAASAEGGKLVRRKVTKNADCTHDVHNEIVEEKHVSGAVVETEKRLEGTVVTTTDRNQPSAPSAASLKVGEQMTVRKTEGGLVDVTRREVTVSEGGVSAGHEETALVHSDVTREIVASDPGSMEQSFSVGEITERSKQATGFGSWTVEERKRTAKPASTHIEWDDVVESGTSVHKYRCGIYVYRNWDHLPEKPDFKHVSASVNINEFGLLDVTYHGQTLVEWSSSGGLRSHEAGTLTEEAKAIEKRKAWKHYRTGKLTFNPKNKNDYYKVDVQRVVTAKKHTKWGGQRDELIKDAASGIDRPDLGFTSKISGGVVVYYNGLKDDGKWSEVEGDF